MSGSTYNVRLVDTHVMEHIYVSNSLMIYKFSSSTDGPSGNYDFAIAFGSLSNYDWGRSMFHQLGFDNSNEYCDNYPGNFTHKSQIASKLGDTNIKASLCGVVISKANIYLEIANSNYFEENALINYLEYDFTNPPMPFVVPTVEEALKAYPISNLQHNDLWFCSDWSDDYA